MSRLSQDFGKTYSLLGVLVSALSAISLARRFADVGLKPIFFDIMAWWDHLASRSLGALMRATLAAWLHLPYPDWLANLHALSFVGAGLMLRSYNALPNITFRRRLAHAAIAVVLGITGIGLMALIFPVIALLYAAFSAEERGLLFAAAGIGTTLAYTPNWAYRLRLWLAIALAVLIFFALNSYY